MSAPHGRNINSIHWQISLCLCIGWRGVLYNNGLLIQWYNTLKAQTTTNTFLSFGCHGLRCSCAKQSSCVNNNGSHSEILCHVDDTSNFFASFSTDISFVSWFLCYILQKKNNKIEQKLIWVNVCWTSNDMTTNLFKITQQYPANGRLSISDQHKYCDALWFW